MKRILFILVCMAAIGSLHAAEWTVETVPSPKIYGQDFYVSNPDGVLSAATEQQLNALCTRLNRNTGAELAVVAVRRFDVDEYYTADYFAYRLFNHWGVGSAETNSGILLFLAEDSRDVQITTGDGIAGMLTDGKCGHILDNNLRYLSKNDFDRGLLGICRDIENELMKDENRAKLYLGWAPEKAEINKNAIGYFAIGFVLMVLLAWWGYHKLQGKPGQKKKEREDEAYPVRLVTGILMLFFPLPLLLFYIYYRILCNRLEDIPPVCSKCGGDMNLLPKEEGAAHLTSPQLFDEQIDAFQHEVWQCVSCGNIEVKPVNGKYYYKFDLCPKCGAHAMETIKRETVSKATVDKDGQQKNTIVCKCCGFTDYKILKLRYEAVQTYRGSYDDDDSGSSGGGLFRGGGGGGSWGGGHSSGGGAGRKF